jgi:hypothetical protein
MISLAAPGYPWGLGLTDLPGLSGGLSVAAKRD